MLAGKSKKSVKTFPVRVTTLHAVLDFDCPLTATGRQMFDLVCRTLGLRETWYFGLQYTDFKGSVRWLMLNKKVLRQGVPREVPSSFLFLVKFYPDNMAEDIIQEITRHLFFLQVKQAVLKMDIYCPPETSVLLASYILHAKFGDFSGTCSRYNTIDIEDLLPESTINQFSLTSKMWMDTIRVRCADHVGLTEGEAEMEFLTIANDLRMIGVTYFSVTDKNKSKCWLGVTPLGINIYEEHDKLCPSTTLKWKDIHKIAFRSRKLVVSVVDCRSLSLEFYVSSVKISELIFDLCIGNHEIFKRKQSYDSMEIQQMKVQANDEREKLRTERGKMIREKQLRVETEKLKSLLEQQVRQYRDELRLAFDSLRRCETVAELLAEKAQLAAEEARLLTEKVSAIETEYRRVKIGAWSSGTEKIVTERKTRASELLMSETEEESKILKEFIIRELLKTDAKRTPDRLGFSSVMNVDTTVVPVPFRLQPSDDQSERKRRDHLRNEIERLEADILMEKSEYNKGNEQLWKQLYKLRSELQILKTEGFGNTLVSDL